MIIFARLDAGGGHELGVLVALEGREQVGQARRDERRPERFCYIKFLLILILILIFLLLSLLLLLFRTEGREQVGQARRDERRHGGFYYYYYYYYYYYTAIVDGSRETRRRPHSQKHVFLSCWLRIIVVLTFMKVVMITITASFWCDQTTTLSILRSRPSPDP